MGSSDSAQRFWLVLKSIPDTAQRVKANWPAIVLGSLLSTVSVAMILYGVIMLIKSVLSHYS